jgi:hypothetical protein
MNTKRKIDWKLFHKRDAGIHRNRKIIAAIQTIDNDDVGRGYISNVIDQDIEKRLPFVVLRITLNRPGLR